MLDITAKVHTAAAAAASAASSALDDDSRAILRDIQQRIGAVEGTWRDLDWRLNVVERATRVGTRARVADLPSSPEYDPPEPDHPPGSIPK